MKENTLPMDTMNKQYYQKSAEQNHPVTRYQMFKIYLLKAIASENNVNELFRLIQELTDQGYPIDEMKIENQILFVRKINEIDSNDKEIEMINLGIGLDGAELISLKIPSTLTTLNLSGNDLGDKGVRILAEKLPKTLTNLYLSNNNISDEGVKSLVDKLSKTSLTTLDLSNNKISGKGVKILVDKLLKTLTLILSNNNISDEEVKILADELRKTSLTILDLSNNNITDKGVKSLADKLPITLTTLNLSGNRQLSLQVIKMLNEKHPMLNVIASDITFHLSGSKASQKPFVEKMLNQLSSN